MPSNTGLLCMEFIKCLEIQPPQAEFVCFNQDPNMHTCVEADNKKVRIQSSNYINNKTSPSNHKQCQVHR